jgi:hypothetical protein
MKTVPNGALIQIKWVSRAQVRALVVRTGLLLGSKRNADCKSDLMSDEANDHKSVGREFDTHGSVSCLAGKHRTKARQGDTCEQSPETE